MANFPEPSSLSPSKGNALPSQDVSEGFSPNWQIIGRVATYVAIGCLAILAGTFLLVFPPAGIAGVVGGLGVYYGAIGAVTFGPGIFDGSEATSRAVDQLRDQALRNRPVPSQNGSSSQSLQPPQNQDSKSSPAQSSQIPPSQDRSLSPSTNVNRKPSANLSIQSKGKTPLQTPMIPLEELEDLYPDIDFSKIEEKTKNAFRRLAVDPRKREEIRKALNQHYTYAKRTVSSLSGSSASSSQSSSSSSSASSEKLGLQEILEKDIPEYNWREMDSKTIKAIQEIWAEEGTKGLKEYIEKNREKFSKYDVGKEEEGFLSSPKSDTKKTPAPSSVSKVSSSPLRLTHAENGDVFFPLTPSPIGFETYEPYDFHYADKLGNYWADDKIS